MQGASFGTLCAQLAAFHAEDAIAARAVALLQVWLAEHWVATVALGA